MKKLIQRWPKPLASFTFKTCYSSTVQITLPRGLDSTCLCTPHNSHTCHEHFPAPAVMPMCPRSHGIVQTQLDKHRNRKRFSLRQSHGSFWCGAGGGQQKLLFIIPSQCSRGTEGGREVFPGGWAVCPWQPLGLSCLSHADFVPWISGAGTWWSRCYATAGSQAEQTLLPSPMRALLCSSPSSFISSLEKPGASQVDL